MNILPHKSWHVRTKKNIARVRKDEAKAAEEEKETQRRVALAAQEARTAFLRDRANQRIVENGEELPIGMPLADVADIIQKDGHVNFFQEIEEGRKQEKVNIEHEEEKKKEQEEYEKKIGYLVCLGQNSGDTAKDKPWYANIDRGKIADLETERKKFKSVERIEQTRASSETQKSELTNEELKTVKFKDFHDPLKSIRKYLSTPGVKKKLDESAEKQSKKRRLDEDNSDLDSRPIKKSKKAKKQKKKKHKHKSSKKHKKHKSAGRDSPSTSESDTEEEDKKRKRLQVLREERLARERMERKRAEIHLAKLQGITLPDELNKTTDTGVRKSSVKQRYNSQFNPHLARQNFDN